MAAPAVTARVTPAGLKLKDGFGAKIAFARDPNLELWEIEVTPPGVDNGDPIGQTTNHNSNLITKWPNELNEITDIEMQCGYDPVALTRCLQLCGLNGEITAHIPDGTTQSVWGYMRSFKPNGLVRGGLPVADVVVVVTNMDGDDAEFGPAVAEVAGT